jgi:phage shock protein A
MMQDNGETSRELLLQLNEKVTEFMVESKMDIATLTEKVDAIKESVKIMNHNSTVMADRITALESKATTFEAQKKAIKDLLDSQRNWTVAIVTIIVSIFTILSLVHVI